MPGYAIKEEAESAAERVNSSLFATDDERTIVQDAISAVRSATSRDAVQEHLSIIHEVLRTVTARESGRAQLELEDRRHIEESLRSLEDRLVFEIKERKASQRRDVNVLLVLLFTCMLGSLVAGIFVVVRGTSSMQGTIGAGLGLSAGIACSLVSARLIQNSREALERLDEKIVAVRFLRMALHPSWTTELGGQLVEPALLMFAQHFAPTSQTLGADDTRSLLENFKMSLRRDSSTSDPAFNDNQS